MQITVQELNDVELITLKGRVDSVEASQLAQALEAANQRGRYKLVIDMSLLEYMSSAGLRALVTAQRSSQHHNRGEVVLAQVPELIREALDVVGFTAYFKILDTVSSALEVAANLPAGDSTTDAPAYPS